MYQLIIIIHVLLGLGIIGLVLMQQGRGADAGAAFGTGSSGSVFGAQGSASFLSRTTAIFAALFFSTSLGLAYLSGKTAEVTDLMQETKTSVTVPQVDPKKAAVEKDIPAVPAATNSSNSPVVPSQPEQPVVNPAAPATEQKQP